MADPRAISPFFIVSDIGAAVSFYGSKLGFGLQYLGPEDGPFFAIVGRGPVSIMLKGAGIPAPNKTRYSWARWDAYVFTDNPDGLFEEYRLTGVDFHQPLRDDDDGLRGFEVADSDGYILFFGRPKL